MQDKLYKGGFCVFKMAFWGGIFGDGHYYHPDPYLTSTIVLFDILIAW